VNLSTSNSKPLSSELKGALVLGAVLLAGYAGLVGMGKVAPGEGTSQAQSNLIKCEELAYADNTPRVVLTGSSLTQNLAMEETHWDALNAGIGGWNALTPLLIMQRAEVEPKLVMIEMGAPLFREVDKETIEQLFNPVTNLTAQNAPVILQKYQPIDVLATKMRQRQGKAAKHDKQVPEAVRQDTIARVLKENGEPLGSFELGRLDNAFKIIEDAAKNLTADGVKVVFYFVPGEPAVDALPRRQQVRELCLKHFPPTTYTWVPDPPDMGWRTNDGVHLAGDGRVRFTQYLKDFADKLAPAPVPPGPSGDGDID